MLQLFRISRPRFWMYTVGTFLVGVAATWSVFGLTESVQTLISNGDKGGLTSTVILFFIFVAYLIYFLFAANLLIYWINDIADGDTDQYNDKKQGYESRLQVTSKSLIRSIVKQHLLFIFVVVVLLSAFAINEISWQSSLPSVILDILPPLRIQVTFALVWFVSIGLSAFPYWVSFFFFSIFYSLPPIRAKAKPFLDGIFNALYIIPWLIGYLTFGWLSSEISWIGFGAWWLRCIAMHTYSAIPDIIPDQQAGLTTTAVLLWSRRTLVYCWALWTIASILWSIALWPIAYIFGIVYLILVALTTQYPIMQVYKRFPLINAIIWFILFWIIAWP